MEATSVLKKGDTKKQQEDQNRSFKREWRQILEMGYGNKMEQIDQVIWFLEKP